MKILLILFLAAAFLTGCATQKTTPKTFTQKEGVAWQSINLESTEWDRTEARQALGDLLEKISAAVTASKHPVESLKTLGVIDRVIRESGFLIAPNNSMTFGDALVARTLDCSDLTLVYLDILDGLGAGAYPTYSRNHVFLILRTKNGYTHWDATLGKKNSLKKIWEKENLTPEMVTEGVYLVPHPPQTILANTYLAMGIRLSREKKFERAEEFFRKTILHNPKLVVGHQTLAAFLCGQGRFSEAEPILKEALRLDPTSPELYDFASALYESTGNPTEAIAMCKRAFVLGTSNEDTLDRFFRLSVIPVLEEVIK